MTKIAIIGWYGTETIGDRAILAGLCHLFCESFREMDIRLGCLDTLLTERTIDEDYDFYLKCSSGKLHNISLFDSRIKKNVDATVDWADLVVIGGGPLMEIDAMFMLLYAFRKAKKLHKKNVVAGCGMGPFKTERMARVASEIVDLSDIAVFRDSKSLEIYRTYSGNNKKALASIDPAVFATQCYMNFLEKSNGYDKYIAVNFREPPVSEYKGLENVGDDFFVRILVDTINNFDCSVRLVPMHTYWVGDDDRYLLNRICRKLNRTEIFVYNKPLSLEKTMEVYANAECCIGMRFHAVLLQTFLNGRNYIIDYTDPQKGKIINLLNQIGLKSNFNNSNRYISLVNHPAKTVMACPPYEKFNVEKKDIKAFKNVYLDNFLKLQS